MVTSHTSKTKHPHITLIRCSNFKPFSAGGKRSSRASDTNGRYFEFGNVLNTVRFEFKPSSLPAIVVATTMKDFGVVDHN